MSPETVGRMMFPLGAGNTKAVSEWMVNKVSSMIWGILKQ